MTFGSWWSLIPEREEALEAGCAIIAVFERSIVAVLALTTCKIIVEVCILVSLIVVAIMASKAFSSYVWSKVTDTLVAESTVLDVVCLQVASLI